MFRYLLQRQLKLKGNRTLCTQADKKWDNGLRVIEFVKEGEPEDALEILNNENVDYESEDQFGSTALILSARRGDVILSKELIRRGANINAQNHFGSTALVCAATNGHLEIVSELLTNGADVNIRTRLGGSALVKSAASGQLAVCKLLLEAGADSDIKTKLGDSIEGVAKKAGHQSVVDWYRSLKQQSEQKESAAAA